MMKSKRCLRALYGGALLYRGEILHDKVVVFDDRIRAILDLSALSDLSGDIELIAYTGLLTPGLIDIHIHGSAGHDTMAGTPEAIRAIAGAITRSGTTSFLATTMTADAASIDAALEAARAVRREQASLWGGGDSADAPKSGAELLGVHLEGPFIAPEFKGAQPLAHIRPLDVDWVRARLDIVRVITLAPELDGATPFIRALANDCVIALGHSGASYECAVEAFRSGARHITHCFNAMSGLHHRSPGLVGAALAQGFSADFIVDGLHIHRDLLEAILRIKAPPLRLLITDAIRGAMMPDGCYELGGQRVRVERGAARLADGTLAGSVLTADQAVRNVLQWTSLGVPDAISMMSEHPARLLGIEGRKGRIEVGCDADLVVWDGAFAASAVYVRGVRQ